MTATHRPRGKATAAHAPAPESDVDADADGSRAARRAGDSATAIIALLENVADCGLEIAASLDIKARFAARRLILAADTLAVGEAEPDPEARSDSREEASYAFKGVAGLISLMQVGCDPTCPFGEALVQMEHGLLACADDLLVASGCAAI